MTEPSDDRSPFSKAIATASQITTIGLTMVIPVLLGYFVDQWAGTFVLFVFLGLVLGVASAVFQLSKLVAQLNAAGSGLPGSASTMSPSSDMEKSGASTGEDDSSEQSG